MGDNHGKRMAAMHQRFLERAARDRAVITSAFAVHDWPEVQRVSHGLAGIAGTFGHPLIGDCAYAVEQAIDAGDNDERAEALWRELDNQLAALEFNRACNLPGK